MASPSNSRPEEESELACPYFMPVAKLENGSWPHPARLPLGCGWSGHCTAPGHEDAIPSQDILQAYCNMGYASSCNWAPVKRRWDAVRFAVVSPAKSLREFDPISSEQAPARIIRLTVVYEQNNRPAGQGELEFDLSTTTWLHRHQDVRIQKMAECFLEAYLSRRS